MPLKAFPGSFFFFFILFLLIAGLLFVRLRRARVTDSPAFFVLFFLLARLFPLAVFLADQDSDQKSQDAYKKIKSIGHFIFLLL